MTSKNWIFYFYIYKIYFYIFLYLYKISGGVWIQILYFYSYLILLNTNSCVIMANMLICEIVVSLKSSCAITFFFRLMPLRKVWTPYHSSLVFNNPWMLWRCLWCNCYRRRKWTRRHEFKSWTRLIAFHIALIPLGKVWTQLFSLQLWVNSRTD